MEEDGRWRQKIPGLKLTTAARRSLKQKRSGRRVASERSWRRIRILELLDQGWKLANIVAAAGTYSREVATNRLALFGAGIRSRAERPAHA
jgi:hypothetical protein